MKIESRRERGSCHNLACTFSRRGQKLCKKAVVPFLMFLTAHLSSVLLGLESSNRERASERGLSQEGSALHLAPLNTSSASAHQQISSAASSKAASSGAGQHPDVVHAASKFCLVQRERESSQNKVL